MSTLYNALKKAEAERQKTTTTTGPEKTSPEGGKTPGNTKMVFLVIAVLVVFIFVFCRFKGLIMHGPNRNPVVTTQTTRTLNAPNGITSMFSSQQENQPPYKLDGVINAGPNSLAIINGKPLKVEGTIDTLVVKKISPDEVELLDTKDNSTVVLKIE